METIDKVRNRNKKKPCKDCKFRLVCFVEPLHYKSKCVDFLKKDDDDDRTL